MSEQSHRQSLLLPILIPLGALAVIGLVLFGFSRVLLATSPTAATVVATVSAAAVLSVAAFVASRRQVNDASLFSMVGAVAGVAMLAGGVAVLAAGGEEGGGGAQTVTLAAPPGAATGGFSTDALSVTADAPIALEFDNQDPQVQHNVVIFDGEDAGAPVLFTGELITGPTKQTYAVPALAAGSYFFNCQVHPDRMTGTIEAAEGEGGGAGGPTIAAQGTQFSTSELTFPAGEPVTLTFDNLDDAAVVGLHNVAIYEGEAELFKGAAVSGPETVNYEIPALEPGTYEFRCDFHATMTGTLVVEETGGGGEGGGAGDAGGGGGGAGGGG